MVEAQGTRGREEGSVKAVTPRNLGGGGRRQAGGMRGGGGGHRWRMRKT